MNYLLYPLLAFAVLIAALQVSTWLRAKSVQGRAAPPSAAGPGRRLYYFFSPRCAPCRGVTPVIDRLAARHPNVFKVDASADLEQARAFGVAATPTLMLVEDGRIVRVIVGSTSEKNLESLLHS
jgi:thioredoxin 1